MMTDCLVGNDTELESAVATEHARVIICEGAVIRCEARGKPNGYECVDATLQQLGTAHFVEHRDDGVSCMVRRIAYGLSWTTPERGNGEVIAAQLLGEGALHAQCESLIKRHALEPVVSIEFGPKPAEVLRRASRCSLVELCETRANLLVGIECGSYCPGFSRNVIAT